MPEKLCVFCGANSGKNKKFEQTAYNLGRLIAEEKIELVYGGGKVGLMGVIADSVLENGGKVTGIIPGFLKNLGLCHNAITKTVVCKTMRERKRKMCEMSDYFFVLPGGIGTLDEVTEVITLSQLGVLDKPCVLINIDGFFDDFIRFLNKTVDEKFFKKEHLNLLIVETSVEAALEKCRSFVYPETISKFFENIKGHSNAV